MVLLTVIQSIDNELYVFQQDNALAHHAHQSVELLHCETLEFAAPGMWLPNSLDLNMINYCIWGVMQERVNRTPSHDVADPRQIDESRRRSN